MVFLVWDRWKLGVLSQHSETMMWFLLGFVCGDVFLDGFMFIYPRVYG